MEKLYYEAIRKLPEHFVDDGTKLSIMDKDHVLAMHYQFGPMLYSKQTGEWKKLEVEKVRK